MRIILSNDDGIHAPGIQQLVVALRLLATVQIVSPDPDRSGASNSLTLDVQLRIQTQFNGNIAILSGTSTDCIYLGVNALVHLGQDIVGDDVIYSGTVAATIEERHLCYSALAVSLDGSCHFATTAVITCCLLRLTHAPLRTGKIFNVNVPDLPLSSINGYKATLFASEVIHKTESIDKGPDTDFEAVSQSHFSLTPLQVDLTTNAVLPVLSDWLGDTEGFAPW